VSTLHSSLGRNALRTGKARVPDVALYATVRRLVPPSASKGFDSRFRVAIAGCGFDVSAWVPLWQRRGVGFVWEYYQKEGLNPRSGEKVMATRRRARVVEELPMKDEYAEFVRGIAAAAS